VLQSPLHLHEITARSLEASNTTLKHCNLCAGPLIVIPFGSGTCSSSFVGNNRSMTPYSARNCYRLAFGITRTRPNALLSVDPLWRFNRNYVAGCKLVNCMRFKTIETFMNLWNKKCSKFPSFTTLHVAELTSSVSNSSA